MEALLKHHKVKFKISIKNIIYQDTMFIQLAIE